MRKKLLHSIARQELAVAADGVETFDLGVNPLSMALIVIRPLNDNAGTPTTGPARYLEMVGAIDRVTVSHLGSSVFSMSGRDAAALNYFRHGILPMEANFTDTDNERRAVVLPILFGRFGYDSRSCFPATKRGELTMELQIDVADTGYDTFRYSVETVELLGAEPKEFERKTSLARTQVVGDNDHELPNGRVIRGVLGFGTTRWTGAVPASTLGRLRLMVDNQEIGYSATDFEVAQTIGQLLGRQFPGGDAHFHRVNAPSASAVEPTGGPVAQGTAWSNYCYLDLDPTRDDEFAVDTKGAASVILRNTAEAADAARFITIERMEIGG